MCVDRTDVYRLMGCSLHAGLRRIVSGSLQRQFSLHRLLIAFLRCFIAVSTRHRASSPYMYSWSHYTVIILSISTDNLWPVVRILTVPVPYTFVSVNRRSNKERARRFTDTNVYGTGSVKIMVNSSQIIRGYTDSFYCAHPAILLSSAIFHRRRSLMFINYSVVFVAIFAGWFFAFVKLCRIMHRTSLNEFIVFFQYKSLMRCIR